MIYPHHLDFMEEAKKAFESNHRFETYRNKAGNLLALRYGMDRNCIAIHEIGEEIAFFAEVLEKAPELVVDAPTLNRFKTDGSFDIRKEMLARPNEWVGAFKEDGEWHKVGFSTLEMSAVETLVWDKTFETFNSTLLFDDIAKCIPIEEVPKEELQ